MSNQTKRTVPMLGVVALAIVAISVLEGIALWAGLDGAVFGIVIATVAGLAAGAAGFKLSDIIPR
ncbi:MAG: hypothetical protein AMJ38_00565 [Dehalococcoidia bacterium DG_22]|nr:MAG: hypothetical protein AMJ38_00565 [Dehalococcoidia bacterium DG_22]